MKQSQGYTRLASWYPIFRSRALDKVSINEGFVTAAYSLASNLKKILLPISALGKCGIRFFRTSILLYELIKITAEGALFLELADYRLSDYREIWRRIILTCKKTKTMQSFQTHTPTVSSRHDQKLWQLFLLVSCTDNLNLES